MMDGLNSSDPLEPIELIHLFTLARQGRIFSMFKDCLNERIQSNSFVRSVGEIAGGPSTVENR